jgi:CheY-specific phosphatase CheX
MPWNELNPSLGECTQDVLETMFFTSVVGEAEAENADERIAARLGFRGNPEGAFGVSVSAPAARTIAAGFLGIDDEEVTPKQVGEVVCEMANMICGSVLSRVPSDQAFELAHPQLVEPEAAAHGRGGKDVQSAKRSFDLGDGAIQVYMELHCA